MKKGPTRDNFNSKGRTMVYKKPKISGRQIKDVLLDCEQRVLQRPSKDAYKKMYN